MDQKTARKSSSLTGTLKVATLPNCLSFFRLLLAPALLFPPFRFAAIILACLSDILDGFFARLLKQESAFGAIIDPLADKVFVLSALALFFYEGSLSFVALAAFLSRDLSLLFFFGLLLLQNRWKNYQIRAFFCGKVATSLQFVVLAFLSLEIPVPALLIWALFVVGGLSFVELVMRDRQTPVPVATQK